MLQGNKKDQRYELQSHDISPKLKKYYNLPKIPDVASGVFFLGPGATRRTKVSICKLKAITPVTQGGLQTIEVEFPKVDHFKILFLLG